MAQAPDWSTYLKQLAGGDTELYRFLRTVIDMESSGNPNAVNVNTNGSIDRGLFQLNNNYGGKGLTPTQQFNPYINIDVGARPLIAAYQKGKAQGLAGFELFQFMNKNGAHPALLTRSDAAAKFQQWTGSTLPAVGGSVAAGLSNLVTALSQPGGANAATPPGGVTAGRDTQQAENSGVDANGDGRTGTAGTGSLWAWITSGDISQLGVYAQTAGWSLAGLGGGALLVILGVVLVSGSFRGGE